MNVNKMMKNFTSKINSMEDIYRIFSMSDYDFIKWLSMHRFILDIQKIYKCPICNRDMHICFSNSYTDGGSFICQGQHRHKRSIRTGTFFSNSKIKDLRFLILLYATWALDMTPLMAKNTFPSLPDIDTIYSYYSLFRGYAAQAYQRDILANPLG